MEKAIQQLIEKLSHVPTIKRIILFGSRARNDAEDRSDIDIAIDCPTATDLEWTHIYFIADEIDTLLKIDMIRYDTASQELREKIQLEGKVLYERH